MTFNSPHFARQILNELGLMTHQLLGIQVLPLGYFYPPTSRGVERQTQLLMTKNNMHYGLRNNSIPFTFYPADLPTSNRFEALSGLNSLDWLPQGNSHCMRTRPQTDIPEDLSPNARQPELLVLSWNIVGLVQSMAIHRMEEFYWGVWHMLFPGDMGHQDGYTCFQVPAIPLTAGRGAWLSGSEYQLIQ